MRLRADQNECLQPQLFRAFYERDICDCGESFGTALQSRRTGIARPHDRFAICVYSVLQFPLGTAYLSLRHSAGSHTTMYASSDRFATSVN